MRGSTVLSLTKQPKGSAHKSNTLSAPGSLSHQMNRPLGMDTIAFSPDEDDAVNRVLHYFFFLGAIGLGIWFLRKSFTFVKPGQRVVMWKRYGENAGRVKVLESGTHYMNMLAWARFGQGPFGMLVPSMPWYACPVPNSTVFVDPDRIEIMSADGVPGTANVSLELQVLDWSASDLIGQNILFKNRACVTVNQWVSNQLGKLSALKLCSYADVVSSLNNREGLKVLNDELRDCFLEAKRISVDPSGITMHAEYSKTVGIEIQQRRKWDLQRLEAQAVHESTERSLKLQLMQTQAECEQVKMKAEVDKVVEKSKADTFANRASALINSGITPLHVANILISEVATAGISRASKVVVGMPQGMIGLRGAESVYDGYEKV